MKVGVEFTPARYDVRHFFKRWSYRAGFRYGNYHQTFDNRKLSQYAVTAGVGVPVKFLAISAVDIGFEYGRRGYNIAGGRGWAGHQNGEYWFLRPKYD